jgi:hypothetical protein
MNHGLTSCIALIWAISTLIWTGDFKSAETYAEEVIARAKVNSFAPYLVVARGFQGELAIRRGRAREGVEALRGCLQTLHAAPYELLTTPLAIALAEGLAAMRDVEGAQALVSDTIALVERRGDVVYVPELLRLQGGFVAAQAQGAGELARAEKLFERSLDVSRAHGSRAWTLRTATDLAALWAGQGRAADAGRLLGPALAQFTEGFETHDLVAATDLLERLETCA